MIINTWYAITKQRNITEWAQAQLGIWAKQYNLKPIEEEIEAAVQDEMPEGYSFEHLAFHKDEDAPTPLIYLDNKGDLDLHQLLDSIDYWQIFEANEKEVHHVSTIAPNTLI